MILTNLFFQYIGQMKKKIITWKTMKVLNTCKTALFLKFINIMEQNHKQRFRHTRKHTCYNPVTYILTITVHLSKKEALNILFIIPKIFLYYLLLTRDWKVLKRVISSIPTDTLFISLYDIQTWDKNEFQISIIIKEA